MRSMTHVSRQSKETNGNWYESLPVVQAQLDHTHSKRDGRDVDISVSPPIAIAEPLTGQIVGSIMELPLSSSTVLNPIHDALRDHDQTTNTTLQKKHQADEKACARDEWTHKNREMGGMAAFSRGCMRVNCK
eukprot:CCRYP_001146-RA/>CCRYP_001146-RA protein AED:0.42 eAED:0.51 QI:0/0/0/1/0/0/2/0/131